MARDFTVLIMAAGHGTRMRSSAAKVLHPVSGRPMLLWLASPAEQAGAHRVVCLTRPADGGAENPDDVPAEVLGIREINVGTYAFSAPDLLSALDEVEEASTGERYLTTVVEILRERGEKLVAHPTRDRLAAIGVNDRADLIEIEAAARKRLLLQHAFAGVTLTTPEPPAL